MKSYFQILERGLALAGASLLLTGCPPKKPMPTAEVPPAEAEALPGESPALPESGPLSLEIGSEWTTAPNLEAAYFEYNKADLRPDARASLKRNAAVLKSVLRQAPSVQLRLEGHCDDRGTLEYNTVLGQRRANALRDYYASLGVAKSALTTISYGEERPVCTEADENCWWRNRRGETTLRSPSGPVSIPLDSLASGG
jgi:peptidoglycan-associated lipoprotein